MYNHDLDEMHRSLFAIVNSIKESISKPSNHVSEEVTNLATTVSYQIQFVEDLKSGSVDMDRIVIDEKLDIIEKTIELSKELF